MNSKSAINNENEETFGESLIAGLQEANAHVKGELRLNERIYEPAPVDVKAIREKAGFDLEDFAAVFALPPDQVRRWERGEEVPNWTMKSYLKLIKKNPKAAIRAIQTVKL
ncbi:MAG: transcriptional regulator [Bryobacterales bacterium]|nr:transcriptional regulator [Bryobacterales bacterium]